VTTSNSDVWPHHRKETSKPEERSRVAEVFTTGARQYAPAIHPTVITDYQGSRLMDHDLNHEI